MKKTILLLALSMMVAAPMAFAEEGLSYNYADASYEWTHYDDNGVGDSNGLDANLSLSPFEYFALEGGYSFASLDLAGHNAQVNEFRYGALGYYPFCENVHALMRVGGFSDNVHVSGAGHENDNGVYAGAGMRYQFLNAAELEGNITYSHVKGSPADWNYEVVGLYPIAGGLALKTSASICNQSDVALSGGLRYSF